MPYEIDYLSIDDLKIIFLVMDDIYTKFMLSQDYGGFRFGTPKGLDGVSADYQKIVIDKLIYEGYLLNTPLLDYDDDLKEVQVIEEYVLEYTKEFSNLHLELLNRISQQKKTDNGSRFDEEKSILSFRKHKIQIAKQNKKTIAHRILKHIFNKDNPEELSSYVEIEGEEYHPELKLGKKYYAACRDIQKKIEKQTNGEIKDFLNFNSSDKGEVSINKKYL